MPPIEQIPEGLIKQVSQMGEPDVNISQMNARFALQNMVRITSGMDEEKKREIEQKTIEAVVDSLIK